jgi:hypothetical protein
MILFKCINIVSEMLLSHKIYACFAGVQFSLAWTLRRGSGLWLLCFMALIKPIRRCTIS